MPEQLDARYWRDRAEESRAMADGMRDPEARRVMLNIAASYDWMAELAEKGPAPPPPRKES
jgi:hypothetical protein